MQARAALAIAALLASAVAAGPAAAAVYQWTDSRGIIRYTPDPDTVPNDRRDTLVLVEPGMIVPQPDPLLPSTTIYAPPDDVQFAADPFNAPSQAQSLRAVPAAGATAAGATAAGATGAAGAAAASAELARRLRGAQGDETRRIITRHFEVEQMIAHDEERVKQIISSQAAPMDGHDVHPPEVDAELRQIARRLPALQAELRSLEAEQARLERR